MMRAVDLNADVGEGMDGDAELLGIVTSANIACGLHAGDADTMARTVDRCLAHGVAIGAHPSFDDRDGFGRREMDVAPVQVRELVLRQMEALADVVRRSGARLSHVKAHGALYNQAAREAGLARAIAEAVRDFDPRLVLVGLAGSALIDEGVAAGLRVANEVFADRAYRADGSLVPRSQVGSVIDDAAMVVERALGMVRSESVRSVEGIDVPIRADTICVHGDTPGAASLARALRDALLADGTDVRRAA